VERQRAKLYGSDRGDIEKAGETKKRDKGKRQEERRRKRYRRERQKTKNT
jgi:hypothetical protein